MNKRDSWRDVGTLLGGVLGLFMGGMAGFALCLKFVVQRVTGNDGPVQPNQVLLTFLGVLAAACVGAGIGVVVVRLAFAAYARAISAPDKKG